VRDCVGANYPEEFVAKARTIMTAQLVNFRKAVEAGVKIGFGTDIGVCRFGDNAKEFKLMVDNGMSPMHAIQAATIVDAELLGQSQQIGSITPGKWADIIAVRGDPIADVRQLEDVRFVMKEGRIYKQD
jgi:imidazolonepropionase-like amidohydrolase